MRSIQLAAVAILALTLPATASDAQPGAPQQRSIPHCVTGKRCGPRCIAKDAVCHIPPLVWRCHDPKTGAFSTCPKAKPSPTA